MNIIVPHYPNGIGTRTS